MDRLLNRRGACDDEDELAGEEEQKDATLGGVETARGRIGGRAKKAFFATFLSCQTPASDGQQLALLISDWS